MKRILVAILIWALLAAAAFAHSFNMAMVVPAGARVQAMQAFLLASGERDRHANEENYGHLGGLDVYVSIFEMDVNAADLRAMVLAAEPDIIALVGPELQGMGLERVFELASSWVLPVYSASPRVTREFLAAGRSRFTAQTSDQAGDVAQLSYIAARLIDLAVRAQGAAADTGALEATVEGY